MSAAEASRIKLSSPATKEFWAIPVLFEDEHLIALNKPGCLLTAPDPNQPERPSLMQLLHQGITGGKPWAVSRGLTYLTNAHGLDADVSGVLLLAKDKQTQSQLGNVFGSEKPLLNYVALTQGSPLEDDFEIDAKIAPHPVVPGLMRTDPKRGKRSRTRFRVRERYVKFALLECQPLTHRSHQIAVHLRRARLALVGDHNYNGRPLFLSRLKPGYHAKKTEPERPLIGRAALHVESIRIEHPVTREQIAISAPWPKDFSAAVKYLREFARA